MSENLGLGPNLESAGSAEPSLCLAAPAFGEGPLTLRIAAGVEASHRSRRRGGADKGDIGLGQQSDMDVVADKASAVDGPAPSFGSKKLPVADVYDSTAHQR
jgi:hypothetical protein